MIDTNGLFSGQLDVVVTNEHHPSIEEEAGAAQFMIEGVACAAEVKTTLTSEELRKAIVSCEKFKKLTTLFKSEDTASANPADVQRDVMKRPFFVFAMESDICPDTLVRNLNEEYPDRGASRCQPSFFVFDCPGRRLDFGVFRVIGR